jgi:hypothetical protein
MQEVGWRVLEKGSKQRVLLHLVKFVVADLYDPVDITRLGDLPGEVCSAHGCAVQMPTGGGFVVLRSSLGASGHALGEAESDRDAVQWQRGGGG